MFAELGPGLILEPHEMAKRAPEFYQSLYQLASGKAGMGSGNEAHIISGIGVGNNQDAKAS